MNNASHDGLSGRLIQHAEAALSAHYGNVDARVDRIASIRDNSRVFHATVHSDPPVQIAIKCCLVHKTETPDPIAAATQFAALQRVNKAMAGCAPRFSTPTALFLNSEHGFFAMSWAAGESLTGKMNRIGFFKDGSRWFENVGAWLGHFHRSGFIESRVADVRDRLEVIAELAAGPLRSRQVSAAESLLRKKAPYLTDTIVSVAWLHGDCKTDNFILDADSTHGIDISLVHANPVEYDLAQFFNTFDLLLHRPQHLHLLCAKSSLERAFWKGYSTGGVAVSQTYLDWLRLMSALNLWENSIEGRQRSLRTWILNRMFSRLTDRLYRKLV